MKPAIFIDGEHGTTGLQIIERLAARDDIDLLSITHSDRHDVEKRRALLSQADIAILCLPDDAAREAVAMAQGAGTRFIDASTAHRVDPDWTFGFRELDPGHAEIIAGASRISNPGCYSTGAIALLRPLTKAGLLPAATPVTVNAVSGYSGGGKGLIAQMEGAEGADLIDAPHFLYATSLRHKHVPEITHYGGLTHAPIFSPSVGKFPQGMIVQIPLHLRQLSGGASKADIRQVLADAYGESPFVRVASLDESDAVVRLDPTMLNGTDKMDLFVFGNEDQVNLVAVLDNLGKGASGACVQALDLMIGAE